MNKTFPIIFNDKFIVYDIIYKDRVLFYLDKINIPIYFLNEYDYKIKQSNKKGFRYSIQSCYKNKHVYYIS